MAHGVILGQKTSTDDLLPRDGTRAMEADLNVGNHKVTNVANGTNGTDAVNLNQTNSLISSATADFVTEDEATNIANNAIEQSSTDIDIKSVSKRLGINPYFTLTRAISSYSTSITQNELQYTSGAARNANNILFLFSDITSTSGAGHSTSVVSSDGGYTWELGYGPSASVVAYMNYFIFSSTSTVSDRVARFARSSNGTSGSSYSVTLQGSEEIDNLGSHGCCLGYTSEGVYALSNGSYIQSGGTSPYVRKAAFFSPNGSSWSQINSYTKNSSGDFTVNGMSKSLDTTTLIAATSYGLLRITSSDGSWSRRHGGIFSDVGYINGIFVAISKTGYVFTSTDNGSSWKQETLDIYNWGVGYGTSSGSKNYRIATNNDSLIIINPSSNYQLYTTNGMNFYPFSSFNDLKVACGIGDVFYVTSSRSDGIINFIGRSDFSLYEKAIYGGMYQYLAWNDNINLN